MFKDLPATYREQSRRDDRYQHHKFSYTLIHVEAETWYVQVNGGDVWGVTWEVWNQLSNTMGEQEEMRFSTEVVPTSHDRQWTDQTRYE